MVRPFLGKAENGSFKRWRSIVQKLLKSGLSLDRLRPTVSGSHAAVVTRASKGGGKILARERGGVVGERGPEHLGVSEESGVFPRKRVVGVGISDLDNVVTIGAATPLTGISRLSVSTGISIVVSVGT